MDSDSTLLQNPLLQVGVTVTLAIVLFSVYFFMARKRARKVPIHVFVIFAVTTMLYVVLLLHESDLVEWVDLWERVYLWTRFAAYLGTAFLIIKAIDLVFVEDFLISKHGFYVPNLLRMLFVLAALTIVALSSLHFVMGINVIALVAIPTALTAIIGFALQDTIKRFFAGLTLGELVRVGDWVCVAGREGRVMNVDLSYLSILTREDYLVMIPNNVVLQEHIVNYHKPTRRHARTVTVNVGYGTPPLETEKILEDSAKAVPGVIHDPAPRAFISAFRDVSMEYRVMYWIDEQGNGPETEGQVLSYVWYALRRHGMGMPGTPLQSQPSVQSGAQRERILTALQHIDFLSALSPEELNGMAEQATVRLYLPGEAVIHQGDEGSEMFFILEGEAEVSIGEGPESTVATLKPLQFFGEMSLLTGERRSATIVARTRLEVLVLNKEAMARSLKNNPALVQRMSQVLVERKSGLAAFQEQAAHRKVSGRNQEDQAHTLGARIRDFFGI
jgi:small-conductance mechanosensitive channel